MKIDLPLELIRTRIDEMKTGQAGITADGQQPSIFELFAKRPAMIGRCRG